MEQTTQRMNSTSLAPVWARTFGIVMPLIAPPPLSPNWWLMLDGMTDGRITASTERVEGRRNLLVNLLYAR